MFSAAIVIVVTVLAGLFTPPAPNVCNLCSQPPQVCNLCSGPVTDVPQNFGR